MCHQGTLVSFVSLLTGLGTCTVLTDSRTGPTGSVEGDGRGTWVAREGTGAEAMAGAMTGAGTGTVGAEGAVWETWDSWDVWDELRECWLPLTVPTGVWTIGVGVTLLPWAPVDATPPCNCMWYL